MFCDLGFFGLLGVLYIVILCRVCYNKYLYCLNALFVFVLNSILFVNVGKGYKGYKGLSFIILNIWHQVCKCSHEARNYVRHI